MSIALLVALRSSQRTLGKTTISCLRQGVVHVSRAARFEPMEHRPHNRKPDEVRVEVMRSQMSWVILRQLMYSLLLFSTIAFGASVDVDTSNDDASGRYTSIFYVGEIESKDVQIIKSALERSRRAGMTQVRIFLNSTGGDVDAAIAIGREIRNAKASTWIPSMFSCASACVFVLAAGVDKFVYGAVIIHRPFAESLPKGMTYEKVRFLHSKTEAAVKQYLLEMNVSPALYDEMFSIEP